MEDRPPGRRFLLLDHPLAVGFTLFVLFGLLHVLAQAAGLLLLGFLAILLATVLSYPLDLFARVLPRPLALIFTIALIAGGAAGLALLGLPVLTQQLGRFFQQVPVAIERIAAWWAELERITAMPKLPGGGPIARLTEEATALIARAVPFALDVGSAVFTTFLLFVLGLFLAYAPDSYREALRTLIPREHEPLFDEAWRRLGTTLRHWTTGILLSMLATGSLAALGLLIAGIDGWFLLGIITFLGTFVPYAGAIASAVPGLIVGLAQSPKHFFYAAAVYAGVHLVEGYLLSPFIMKYSVHLQPGLLLFGQLFAGAMFGLPGIIVATPLLACAKVAVGYFYVERRLGKEPPRS
jgi:predicted PurR-regulated permease PerM